MKKMFRLSATVMALGAGLMLATGVANAADTTMMNTMSVKANPNEMMIVMPMNSMDKMSMAMMDGMKMDAMNKKMMNDSSMMNNMSMDSMKMMSQDQMAKMGSWNGVGSVMPSMMDMKQVDYKGAVTTFMSMYPNAQVTSISYDGKHHPMYEVEGFSNGQKMEIHMTEAGEVMSTEVKALKHDMKPMHMKKDNMMKSMDMKHGKMMKDGSMMHGQGMPSMENRMMAKSFNVNDIIMPEVAETKAQEKVGGMYQAIEWTVEKKHGRLMYELDMIDGSGKEAEVKVDAMTGAIINVEIKQTKY